MNWNGIFKSYSVVQVIPVTKMSRDDWRVLEFEHLRNKAKNRIAESLGRDFVGFVQVHVFDKGIGKPFYYMPATLEVIAMIEAGEWKFLHEGDDDLLSSHADLLGTAAYLFGKIAKERGDSGLAEYALDKYADDDVDFGEELVDLRKNFDIEDVDDYDAGLAVATIIVKYLGWEALRKIIDDLQ